MKKRYLAMLMAVLMCFGLFSAGALAGEAESGETESFTAFAAPSGETEAATEETTEETTVEPAGEPQPLDGEGEGGTTPTMQPPPPQPKDITEEPALAYANVPISADGLTGLFGKWTMGLAWTGGDVINGTTLGAMWYDTDTGLCTPLSAGQSVSFTDADGDGKAESLTFDIGKMAPGYYWFVITYDIPEKGLYRGPAMSLSAQKYTRKCWGVAVAGYGGVVTYLAPSSPDQSAASAARDWEAPDGTVVETIPGLSAGYKERGEDFEPGENYWLKVSVEPTVAAGTYRFNARALVPETYSLTVYEPGEAKDTEYQGFDVLKFARENGEQKPLAGAVFAVYTAEWGPDAVELEPVEQIKTYTTDENGLIHVDPKDFGAAAPSPKDMSSRLYILREISAPEGYRASDEAWGFEGSTWWKASGDGRTANLVVSVAPPMGVYDHGWLIEGGQGEYTGFVVCNEPLTSVSIDVEKTVTAKNGAQPGKNTFTFELTTVTDEDNKGISVYFTPEGGARQKLSYTGQTIVEDFSYEQRVYRFSLTVNGAGTAKGVLTVEGTEDELGTFRGEIREKAAGAAGWQYDNRLGGISIYSRPIAWDLDTDGAQEYAADDIEVDLWLDEPQAGRPEGLVLDENDDEFGHIGNDVYYLYEGVWYKAVYLAAGEPLHFVNVYTGAAPAAKAVPTGDGAQPLAWMLLALTAAAAAAVILLRRKTEE